MEAFATTAVRVVLENRVLASSGQPPFGLSQEAEWNLRTETTAKFKEWSTLFWRSRRMAWRGRGREKLNAWIRNKILWNGGPGIRTMRDISSRNSLSRC